MDFLALNFPESVFNQSIAFKQGHTD